jgi:YegS/Rv2252/BmrU family lipid kinase
LTNPAAGKKNSCDELCAAIDAACATGELSYEIYRTTCAGDATRFVRETCENNTQKEELCFFACGGDGTLNEVVSGTIDYPFAYVGLIPKGTGNDFVRNFTNKERFFDISAQVKGYPVTVDLLRCNDRYAVNMINIGFDCEVVKKMVQIKRSPLVPSKLAYIFGLVFTLIKKPGVHTKVSYNGADYTDHDLLLTTMANGCFCGGGFHSNPRASLTDGNVDSLLINNVSRIKFLSLVSSYKKGTHLVPKNDAILSSNTCKTLDMIFDGIQSISIDGELHDIDRELHIEVLHSALKFMIPEGCALVKQTNISEEEKVGV